MRGSRRRKMEGIYSVYGKVDKKSLRVHKLIEDGLGATRGSENSCPSCGADLTGFLFEDPWFKLTGGHPCDSGPGGNRPQEPVGEGEQSCPHCRATWEVSG